MVKTISLRCVDTVLAIGKKVCRYNWHSAGYSGCPFPMLKHKYIFFQNKINRSNFIKQQTETVMVWYYQNADCSLSKKIIVSFTIISTHFRFLSMHRRIGRYQRFKHRKSLLKHDIGLVICCTLIIPAKAFARDYGITGVGLSVHLSGCLSVCYHDN